MSGEIQLQFSLADPTNEAATELDLLNKFRAIASSGSPRAELEEDEASAETPSPQDEDDEDEDDTSDEAEDPAKPETAEKRKRRLRLKALKKKSKARAYEFTGGSDCVGMLFLEIGRITDLPPERNGWRRPCIVHSIC